MSSQQSDKSLTTLGKIKSRLSMSGVTDFKKKAKGKMSIKLQKKKVFRETEPLVAIFMWGINYTVSLVFFCIS